MIRRHCTSWEKLGTMTYYTKMIYIQAWVSSLIKMTRWMKSKKQSLMLDKKRRSRLLSLDKFKIKIIILVRAIMISLCIIINNIQKRSPSWKIRWTKIMSSRTNSFMYRNNKAQFNNMMAITTKFKWIKFKVRTRLQKLSTRTRCLLLFASSVLSKLKNIRNK